MLYIIDKNNFDGCIVTTMPDDVRTKYTNQTMKEFRESRNNSNLITVTPEEFELMRDKYKLTLLTPFKEITEDEFFGIFKKEKINTGTLEKGFACFFFGEFNSWGIYDCYCEVESRYYMGKKIISITRQQVEDEVKLLHTENNLKNVVVLDFYGSLENDALCRYLDKYDMKDIGELFDQDTCKIKIKGHDYPFIKVESNEGIFIIYWDAEYDFERKGLETILFLFFSDGFEEHFTKKHSVWSDYVEGCIAFKEWGQSVFTIWQYNGELPQQNIN